MGRTDLFLSNYHKIYWKLFSIEATKNHANCESSGGYGQAFISSAKEFLVVKKKQVGVKA